MARYKSVVLGVMIGGSCAIGAAAVAETETIFQTVGMDTPLTFTHAFVPGTTGIDFSFSCAIAPTYPDTESNILVITFEWGPSDTGPWSLSPDNVKSVRGGETRFFSTGVYHGPSDAPWVRLHMYAGAIMTVSGPFIHTSVPTPGASVLLGAGALMAVRRRR